MPPLSLRRPNIGTFVDLAVLCGAWGFGAWAILRYHYEPRQQDPLRWILAFAAPLNALYLQIRLTPQVAALADARRRAALAVTLLPARSYLRRRLGWPLLRAAAPAATLIPALLLAWDIPFRVRTQFTFIHLIISSLMFSMLSISLAGSLDLFARLLRRATPPGPALFLIPFCWSAAAIGLPIGAAALLTMAPIRVLSGSWDSFWRVVPATVIVIGALHGATLIFAVRRWKTACRRYYQFDFD